LPEAASVSLSAALPAALPAVRPPLPPPQPQPRENTRSHAACTRVPVYIYATRTYAHADTCTDTHTPHVPGCMCTHITHTCTHVRTHMHRYIHHTNMLRCMCTHMYTHVCTGAHTIYMCSSVCVPALYTYMCTHAYAQVHTTHTCPGAHTVHTRVCAHIAFAHVCVHYTRVLVYTRACVRMHVFTCTHHYTCACSHIHIHPLLHTLPCPPECTPTLPGWPGLAQWPCCGHTTWPVYSPSSSRRAGLPTPRLLPLGHLLQAPSPCRCYGPGPTPADSPGNISALATPAQPRPSTAGGPASSPGRSGAVWLPLSLSERSGCVWGSQHRPLLPPPGAFSGQSQDSPVTPSLLRAQGSASCPSSGGATALGPLHFQSSCVS